MALQRHRAGGLRGTRSMGFLSALSVDRARAGMANAFPDSPRFGGSNLFDTCLCRLLSAASALVKIIRRSVDLTQTRDNLGLVLLSLLARLLGLSLAPY